MQLFRRIRRRALGRFFALIGHKRRLSVLSLRDVIVLCSAKEKAIGVPISALLENRVPLIKSINISGATPAPAEQNVRYRL